MFKKLCWLAVLAIIGCIVMDIFTRHFFSAVNDAVMLFAVCLVIYGSRELFKRKK